MKPYITYFAVIGTIAVAALGMTNREAERMFARVDLISATLHDNKEQIKCLENLIYSDIGSNRLCHGGQND